MKDSDSHLPYEFADRFTEPLTRFFKVEAATGVILLLAVSITLIFSNSPWSAGYSGFWHTPISLSFGRFHFSRSLQSWINDGLMTFFFFVVALELKRELVLGELRTMRSAALSFAGAIGGMVVPAAIYATIMFGQPGGNGWGTVMATDTAFVIGSLALLGSRILPNLRLFLLSLAVFDDIGAVLVVAFGYGNSFDLLAMGFALAGLAIVAGAARMGIRNLAIYFALGGFVWLALDAAGIHPTLSGIVLGLMTPTREWISEDRLQAILRRLLAYPGRKNAEDGMSARRDLRRATVATREALSPVERLELALHPWTGFAIMPLFALANAGVDLFQADLTQRLSVAIVVSLVVGKPVGVFTFSWVAVRLGLAVKASDLTWPILAAGALLTGIGFTMSLFIANLAYGPQMEEVATIGILGASIISSVLGLTTLTCLSFRKKR